MKYFIILLTLFFNLNLAYAQDSLRYKEVDDFVKNFPLKVNSLNDLTALQREIKYKFKNDEEKLARAAFIWITNNIEYDCEGFKKGENFYTHQLNDVIVKKKAVCAGYANLFKNFCDYFELNNHIVNGFAYNKGDSIPLNTKYERNHAWNIVGVNKEWKIVDATWGSGWGMDNCKYFMKELKNYYFLADTNFVIQTHFPADSFWQLKKVPYTFDEFKLSSNNQFKQNIKDAKAQDSLYLSTLYKDSIISKKIGDTIRFYFITKNDKDSLNWISIYDDKNVINIYDTVNRNSKGYYYDFVVKKGGSYYIYVTFYNDMNMENVESTKTEYYLLKIANRGNDMLKLPKKVIKTKTKK